MLNKIQNTNEIGEAVCIVEIFFSTEQINPISKQGSLAKATVWIHKKQRYDLSKVSEQEWETEFWKWFTYHPPEVVCNVLVWQC